MTTRWPEKFEEEFMTIDSQEKQNMWSMSWKKAILRSVGTWHEALSAAETADEDWKQVCASLLSPSAFPIARVLHTLLH